MTARSEPIRAYSTVEREGRPSILASERGQLTTEPASSDSEATFHTLYDGPGRQVFGWDITQTVNSALADLDRDARLSVCSSQRTAWEGWSLEYLPHRFFSITREPRKRNAPTMLYDLASFWPGERDLAPVAQKWRLDVPSIVARGDADRRHEYPGWSDGDLAEYATARAVLIGQLASAMLPRLTQYDLKPTKPMGIGSLGSKMLTDAHGSQWVAKYRPDRQPICNGQPLLDLMLQAYYGGRQEIMTVGHSRMPVWRLDLRSAYLWALSWLGPIGFEWERTAEFSEGLEDRMSLWRVRWATPDAWVGPFPFREATNGATVYPQEGEGWYWWPEVRAALRVWGPERIKVQEGYVSPRSGHRPFQHQASRLFNARLVLDAADDPLAAIVKGAGNAAYGKLAQQLGRDGKVGWWYNPGLSGWICSAVRGRLTEAIGAQGPDNPSAMAIMTDGLLTVQKPPATLQGPALGDWKVERFDAATIVRNGLYRLKRPDGIWEVSGSGLAPAFDFDGLLDDLTTRPTATVSGQFFVPHILADLYPEQWEASRCHWVSGDAVINPSAIFRKRDLADLSTLDWSRQLAFVRSKPHGKLGARGELLASSPYRLPPAWSPVDWDPVSEAAQRARLERLA